MHRSTMLVTWVVREDEPAPLPTWTLMLHVGHAAHEIVSVVANNEGEAIDRLVERVRVALNRP